MDKVNNVLAVDIAKHNEMMNAQSRVVELREAHIEALAPPPSADLNRAQRREVQSKMDALKKKLAMLKLQGARIEAMANHHAKSK